MFNYAFAVIATVYALVCLTKELDLGMCSGSKSIEEFFQKEAARKLKTNMEAGLKNYGTTSPRRTRRSRRENRK